MTNPTPSRVSVVGLGEAGSLIHLPALAGLADAVVVGVCDLDPERRRRAEARWHVPAFADLGELIERTRPEVVIVATPPGLHATQCLQAIAAGTHVICEKPFTASLDEADEVIAAAVAAGRQVALNHEFREMPIFRAVCDATLGAPINEVLFAQVWQLVHMPPWDDSGWRGALRYRTLYEAGVHLVDLLMAIFREKPHAVSASISSGGGPDASPDAVVVATLHFSGGRLAQLTQCRVARGQARYFEVRAETGRESLRASFGGRARVSAGLAGGRVPHLRFDVGSSGVAWREVGGRRRNLARNPSDPRVLATREVLVRTLAAFRAGTAPPTPASLARDGLEVIAACYASAETGQRVELDAATVAALAPMQLAGTARA